MVSGFSRTLEAVAQAFGLADEGLKPRATTELTPDATGEVRLKPDATYEGLDATYEGLDATT